VQWQQFILVAAFQHLGNATRLLPAPMSRFYSKGQAFPKEALGLCFLIFGEDRRKPER